MNSFKFISNNNITKKFLLATHNKMTTLAFRNNKYLN